MQVAAAVAVAVAMTASGVAAQEVLVKDGEAVAFLGDSITEFGAARPSGYVCLVASGLEANGIRMKVIGAGVQRHTSNDMLERLDRDVLSKKPNWMMALGVLRAFGLNEEQIKKAQTVWSAPAQVQLTNRWSFDGNLADTSGNGNHGTLSSGSETYVARKFGKAISLSGLQEVNHVAASGLPTAGMADWSMNVWANPVNFSTGAGGETLAYFGRAVGQTTSDRSIANTPTDTATYTTPAPEQVSITVLQPVKENTGPMKIDVDPARPAAGTVTVPFQSRRPVIRAVVNYANNAGGWLGRSFASVPAIVEKDRIVAPLPAERPIAIFVSLYDDRGLVVSTPHQILESAVSGTNMRTFKADKSPPD